MYLIPKNPLINNSGSNYIVFTAAKLAQIFESQPVKLKIWRY
jgi:hypothetical protein